MKLISLKTIIGLCNILLYLSSVMVFLAYGFNNLLSVQAGRASAYAALGLAFFCIVLYQVLRPFEHKNSKFKYTKKLIIFTRIFYIGQYFIMLMAVLYVILCVTKNLYPNGVRIYFYVFFPLTFIITNIIAFLESIARVEERIFVIKQKWIASKKWEKEQAKQKGAKMKLNFKDQSLFKKDQKK